MKTFEDIQDFIKKHNEIVRNIIGVQSGREIKHTGDGIMACFKSTSKAVMASVSIQRIFRNTVTIILIFHCMYELE